MSVTSLPAGRQGWVARRQSDGRRSGSVGQDRFRAGERLEISYLWLVPITPAEAEFGRQHGGHVLFHEFADADVDLLEIRRQSFK